MLLQINEITQELLNLLKDDPVRPEIPASLRVNANSRVYVLKDNAGVTQAVTCVKFLSEIPDCVDDLAHVAVNMTTAVFYTIWSYAQGAGRNLIAAAQHDIKTTQPDVTTFVTLSPKTEMARRFHLKNGAVTYRENPDSVNYLYH